VLHRDFLEWLGLGQYAATEQGFLQELALLGWRSIDGWLNNICLAEDFGAALWRLNVCPGLSGGTQLQRQSPAGAKSAQSENAQKLARAARAGGDLTSYVSCGSSYLSPAKPAEANARAAVMHR
jgi:hypothetical protein